MENILGAVLALSPTIAPSPVNELTISTDSAQIIANSLEPVLSNFLTQLNILISNLTNTVKPEVLVNQDWNWPNLVLGILTVIIALASLFTAWKASQTSKHALQVSKDSYTSEVLKLFFEIMKEFPHQDDNKPLTKRQKELMCNYLEFVCAQREKGRISEEDMEIVDLVLQNPTYQSYASQYQKDHGAGFYSSYLKCLDKLSYQMPSQGNSTAN
jgi:hypothetical protein